MTTTTTTAARVHPDVRRNADDTISVTVPASDFTQALTWVTPAASRDGGPLAVTNLAYGPGAGHAAHYLPRKEWARKPADDYSLSLAATDRYRLHWPTMAVPAAEDVAGVTPRWVAPAGSFNLDTKELVAAAKAWPKTPRGLYLIRVTFTEAGVGDVRLEVLAGDQVIVSQILRIADVNFPKYASLVPTPVEGSCPSSVAWNPIFLADMAKATKALKVSSLAFRLPSGDDGQVKKAALVVPNEDPEATIAHSAILMPVKF